jgi:hypothetical protein
MEWKHYMMLLEKGVVYLGTQWVIYFCEVVNPQGTV